MLGVLPTQEAKNLARGLELDLVEVNPKAMPPVCKVMDYGRFKYEEKKKQNEARKRQAQVELKEIKLRPKTDDHDLGFKIKHVRRFLEDGNKVKLTVRFRGREITHPETAERQIIAIIDAVVDIGTVEVPARMEGRTMTSILAPRGRPGGGASVPNPQRSEARPPRPPREDRRDASTGPTVEHRRPSQHVEARSPDEGPGDDA